MSAKPIQNDKCKMKKAWRRPNYSDTASGPVIGHADIIRACDKFLRSRGLHPGASQTEVWSAVDCD